VKTVEELREHFTPEILDHFRSGLLAKWLASRKLQDELEAIKALDGAEDALLLKGLCEVFGIEADEAVIATILNDPTPTFGLNLADAVKQSEDGEKIINLADLLPIQPGEIKLFANRFLVFDPLNLEGAELILKSENGILIFKSCEFIINGCYKDLGDGVVLDIRTNLQWMRFSLGQAWAKNACTGEAKKYNWDQAKSAADELNRQGGYAGNRDWRLPSIDELKTLVYCANGQPKTWNNTGKSCEGEYESPAIDQAAFPNTPKGGWFWSSSSGAGVPDGAWFVGFDYDYVGYYAKYYAGYVRLVCGGH
jgi:hypothetical protein